jgi:PAS domain S-box-containing protein
LVESVKPTSSLEGDPPVAATPRAAADHARLAEIALERTRMPIVITDPRQTDNPIVLANQAFLDLSGYNAEEVLGRNCRFLQGAGTSPVAIDAIRAGVAAEQDFHVEILNYRKDGTAFWNQLNVSPVHDEAGQLLYFFASQIDVTDFRKVQTLEASEHRLLKEVDHRARNVMAVVNGIVRLTRADDSRRYAEAIQLRVKALADAHTLLAERGWKEVSLGDVVAQQITAVDATRITALGPDVSVSAFVVQPLALVLHELLSNAMAHGALSQPEGTVQITWDDLPASGGFALHWREAGGPAPRRDGPPGFGAAMLTGMIERQLRGSLQQDWSHQALTVHVTIPGSLDGLKIPGVGLP